MGGRYLLKIDALNLAKLGNQIARLVKVACNCIISWFFNSNSSSRARTVAVCLSTKGSGGSVTLCRRESRSCVARADKVPPGVAAVRTRFIVSSNRLQTIVLSESFNLSSWMMEDNSV